MTKASEKCLDILSKIQERIDIICDEEDCGELQCRVCPAGIVDELFQGLRQLYKDYKGEDL